MLRRTSKGVPSAAEMYDEAGGNELMVFSANAFLIGAQRTGTTYLAHLLGLHPQVTVSNPKEPLFFTKNWDRGFDWYAERFECRDSSVVLDASTWYSVAPTAMFPAFRGPSDDPLVGVPDRIYSVCPEARFIYVVRDPVIRTNSLFWMLRREHPGYRRFRSLREAMNSDPFILRSSDYLGQIENYLTYFDRQRFLVVIFEEMVQDLPATLTRCFSFLGVDTASSALDLRPSLRSSTRNESYRYTPFGEFLRTILASYENLERVRRRTRKLDALGVGEWIDRRLVEPIPSIDGEDKAYIEQMFRERNDSLGVFLQRPLAEWNS